MGGSANQSVTWSVNGVGGGDAAVGTITTAGLYTAPAVPPSPNQVTVTATSAVNPARAASATVTITNPAPVLTSVAPATIDAGSGDTLLTLAGEQFTPQSVAQADGTALATNFIGRTQLTATLPAARLATAGTLAVTVVTPAPGGGTSGAQAVQVRLVVAVSPTSATVTVHDQQVFAATVTGSANQSVAWAVNSIAGGNTTVGTISSAGLYSPPTVPPSPNTVTVTATSAADPGRSASAAVTITNPAPLLTSITPAEIDAGSGDTVLTVAGDQFTSQSVARLEGSALTTSFISRTELQATVPASALATAGSKAVTVATPAPGGGTSTSATLAVHVLIAVSPTAPAPLNVNATLQFSASVSGSTNQSVTWSVNGVGGGNATLGTIDSAGFYTAPAVPPSPNTVKVTATSAADPGRSASAAVTITNPAPTLSSIAPTELDAGSGDTTLTLAGSQFTSQSVARLDGSVLATVFVGQSELRATVPASVLATAGSKTVTVETPAPGGGTSTSATLAVHVLIAISPTAPTPLIVGASQQFTAVVTGSANQGVTWSVNGTAGGNATLGTINSAGLYTAPEIPPSPNTITVRATSAVDPARSASATVTITNPAPVLTSVAPATIDAGSADTLLTLAGEQFTPQSVVQVDGTAVATSFLSRTQLTATVPAAKLATAGSLTITVNTPAPGGGTTGAQTVQVRVVVAISPTTAALTVYEQKTFTASVTGSGNQAVTWSVNGVAGGSATVGTISPAGLYAAPAVPPSPNTVTVTATSAADPARSASAAVTITNPAPTLSSITPTEIDAGSGDTTLTLAGSQFTSQSVARLDGSVLATVFVGQSELQATVPASVLATAGSKTVTVATPAPGGGTSASATLAVHVLIAISPTAPAPLNVNATLQFAASVSGSTNQSVTWSVNGIGGGNAAVGTVTTAGLYTAPAVPPTPNTVTVRATSAADPTRSASATVAITNPVPVLNNLSPTEIDASSQDRVLTLNGGEFTPQSVVQADGTALPTNFIGRTQLTATLPAAKLATAGTLAVTVVTPAPGGGTSGTQTVQVRIAVTVSPTSGTVTVYQQQAFTASVAGSANQAVAWTVNGVAGGNTTVGTISSAGLYTPPAVPPSPNTVTVAATSAADPGRSASAAVTITNPAPTLSSITPAELDAGSGDTTLTLAGSQFTSQSVARLDGSVLATVFVGQSELRATVPASVLATAGSKAVTVATPAPGGGSSTSATLTVHVLIAISPTAPAPLNVNATLQFSASVSGSTNQSVTWSVNGIGGGNATLGRISSAGLYTAPAVPPTPNTVTVRATSAVDPARSASATVAIVNPAPAITSVTPSSITVGSGDTEVVLAGSGFVAGTEVRADGILLSKTLVDSGEIVAVIPAALCAAAAELTVLAANSTPGGGTSNAVTIEVRPAVEVSPSAVIAELNEDIQFTAAVKGYSDQSVLWSVSGVTGGDSTVGTISSGGLYLAPGALPSPAVVTVTARSVADPALEGSAEVTVSLPPSDNYPREDAGSVWRPTTPLVRIPSTGAEVAVLDWTAKDAGGSEGDVMAACQSLSPLGIAHVHTTSLAEATAYRFILIAGVLEDNTVSTTEENALQAYVEGGGTLLLWRPSDTGLLGRFAISSGTAAYGTTERPLTFDTSTADPALHYIDADAEVNWRMAYESYGYTRGYGGSAVELARWNGSGESAVLRSDLGLGRVYVFGWRQSGILGMNLRAIVPGEEPPWVDIPVLDSDIVRLMMRAIYEKWAAAPHLRAWAPEGKKAALIITHDVDWVGSYELVPTFVDYEIAHGLKSTFTFTTSPYWNGWIETMYDQAHLPDIQYALDHNFHVASHGFGHFPDWNWSTPYTNGTEDAAHYFPHYSVTLGSIGESTVGELGVSRWLLEKDFPITIDSHRSGHLAIADRFCDGLAATGYRRDTSYAAGVTRGSLPYVLFEGDDPVTSYPVMEYPVTLTDDGLTAENLAAEVDKWDALIRINYANNVPTVLLIHPIDTTLRMQIMDALLSRIADLDDLWIGDWKTFGEFWEAQGVVCDHWP